MTQEGRILIVDSDDHHRLRLRQALVEAGFEVSYCDEGALAGAARGGIEPDLILLSIETLGEENAGYVERVADRFASSALLVLLRFGSSDSLAQAFREGADDIVVMPYEDESLLEVIRRLVSRLRSACGAAQEQASRFAGVEESNARLSDMETSVRELRGGDGRVARARGSEFPRRPSESPRAIAGTEDAFSAVVGEHVSLLSLLKVVRLIAPSRASVLIEGESGTGKGLLAEAIHKASARASGPFVRLSCASLTESLLESEVFGHEKGAFTGAILRREGRFMQADGGTLFLDEVSEIPLSTQVKLLRFLQERTFERVGGNQTIRVDVRVIAATNRPLEQCVRGGTFREDLFYRLTVVPLKVPPLRERASDIPALAMKFLERFARENERAVVSISSDALIKLMTYSWPGNVRELENVMERATVLCEGSSIDIRHLPLHMQDAPIVDVAPRVPGASIEELERWAILRTLESCGGSTSRAAGILGISPRKIQYKLHEYGMTTGKMRESEKPLPDLKDESSVPVFSKGRG
jgi:DNA-binding NtrC family response regulator